MPDINTAPRRLNRLSVVTITIAGTDYVLKNLGTVTLRPGGYSPVKISDRGVPGTPLLGDGNYSEWEIEVTAASKVSGQLYYLMLDQVNATDANLVKEFTLKIDIPNPQSPSTGERFSDSKCFVEMPGGIEFRGGGPGLDSMVIRGGSANPALQWVTY
jgi:hypothetical protein